MSAVDMARTDADSLEFADFFEEEYGALLQLMFGLSGNREEAADLAQEAMARAFERWSHIRNLDQPAGYTYRIGLNLHRQRVRRFLRGQSLLRRAATEQPQVNHEAHVEVLEALGRLPQKLRAALLLADWLGLTSEEAAAVLHIAPASVRSRVHRARVQMRRHLGGPDGQA